MSSPARAEGYDTPAQQREDSTTFLVRLSRAPRRRGPGGSGGCWPSSSLRPGPMPTTMTPPLPGPPGPPTPTPAPTAGAARRRAGGGNRRRAPASAGPNTTRRRSRISNRRDTRADRNRSDRPCGPRIGSWVPFTVTVASLTPELSRHGRRRRTGISRQ